MLMNIFGYGLAAIFACLFLQALILVIASRYYVRRVSSARHYSFGFSLAVVGGVMFLLLLGNLAQIGIWALMFIFLEEFEVFGVAFYHSAVNFSTLGYGDIVMSEEHRILGPLEAVNGVLMIGASTAVLMAAMQDMLKKAWHEHGIESRPE